MTDHQHPKPASNKDRSQHKSFLRASLRRARRTQPQPSPELFRQTISSLASDTLGGRPGHIAAFLPYGTEPPILPALRDLHRSGHRIAVPLIRPRRQLAWCFWEPDMPLGRNSLGIDEPLGQPQGPELFLKADLRLVPALAFDRSGRRLGQGGGYYDALLAALPDSDLASTYGVIYAREILDGLPADPWDAQLTRLLTEKGVRVLTTAPSKPRTYPTGQTGRISL